MSSIDRQRIDAVRRLEELEYTYQAGGWTGPACVQWAEADALHSLLIQRADTLIGCTDGSADQDELEAIGGAIEAYEAVRWPAGKVDGGKG